MSMVIENIVAVMNENVTLVSANFRGETQRYDFKCLKPLAETLKAGDLAIVETRNGIKMVEVIMVHEEFDIDPNTQTVYKWMFQKVDTGYLEALRNRDDVLGKELKKIQRQKTREQALAALGLSSDAVKALQFSEMPIAMPSAS